MLTKDFLAARLRKQVGLEWEGKLVWVKEVESVQERRIVCKNRAKKPGGKNIVGYSILMENSPNNGTPGCFNRRVFIVDPNGVPPSQVYAGVSLDKCRT